ncbi:deleted in malignant brain tumors 1 protein-like isoform X1 [Nerophis ophidion]|uniref:deleted in malignant brain tumors 1 protein-like isoform X1 n=1 Tax=Nerophis ophidion TaxID=159077 RepID=UPI002ADF1A62|nr:deleted in malignant brain tumors 1 protein-like isoform X1 [Nerophis ophidion]
MRSKKHVFYLPVGVLSLLLLAECNREIRLVGEGLSRCSGRLEVFHAGTWGTVCDDHWSHTNADVVCQELGCGSALASKKSAIFGEGTGQIWMDDVECTGKELSILKCSHRIFGENNCGHSEDVGVVCSESVKVTQGSNRCNGQVEIYLDNHWRKVCSTDWGQEEAEVVCREIRCGKPLTSKEILDFGIVHEASGIQTKCLGNETSIAQCSHQPLQKDCTVASVHCSNTQPLRLVNGTNRCSGRVELFYEGQWGTVCDDNWGMQEAAVTCREMKCGAPLVATQNALFGVGNDQTWLDDLECTGKEESLVHCPHRGFGQHDCNHNEDAGVICSETLRLTNGTTHCSGRLEVFHHGKWGKMCNHNWGAKEATMVCTELNCGPLLKTTEYFGESDLRAFRGACPRDATSFSQCSIEETSDTCRGVSFSCAGSPSLKLVNGTDRCSGRVEVYHNSQWGTVCDDFWDIKDAQVVCRAMDCGTAMMAKPGSFFGEGKGEIWLDDMECVGNESSLAHCTHSTFGDNNCGHSEDAGVVCSATIRLINGTDQCSGRVEVSHSEAIWSSVFNVNWGMNEAAVVCREMNCGDPVKTSASFGSSGDSRGYKVSCGGRERSLTQCTLTDYVRSSHDLFEEASIVCSGNVRLAGGHNRCIGRVEFYEKGQWGNVCGELWDVQDAQVVCKQLNCGRAHQITTMAEYGQGSGHTWIEQIECNGIESTLADCRQTPFLDRSCNASSIAGVVCSDSLGVRLVNSEVGCTGRVEVQQGEVWHSVCDANWDMSKAQAVCEHLHCGFVTSAPGGAHYGQSSGPVMEASDSCFANTTTLQQCSRGRFTESTCGHEHDAGLSCAAKVRLVGGWSGCSGRVEVFHQGQWGTVCDDQWDMVSGDVVCRQLGCGHAVSAPVSAHFGRGSGPIWLDNIECSGDEAAITHCNHQGFGENNCGHSEDAGVICLGSLEKPQVTVSPSVEVNWGDNVEFTCSVLTEHMGGTFLLKKTQGSFKIQKYSENEAATFMIPKVNFSHQGSYFCEYQKKLSNNVIYYPQGNPVELSVKVSLEKPFISMTTFQVMVVYSPQEVSVTRGNSFSITCSVHSLYSKGLVYLKNTNTNSSIAKPLFGHSVFYLAYFDFPEIEEKHQGAYVCIYSVNITSKTFWSAPSKSLYVTVVATSSSSVVSGLVSGLVLLLLLLIVGYMVWRRRRQHGGTMVQFSNRLVGALKPQFDDRGNGALDGGDRNPPVRARGAQRLQEDKVPDVDSESSAERVPEDLAGRVCYELEPLVL